MYEFKLPDVGEGIHEAEILKWLVKEGDQVNQDQPLVEVQTDKAVVEISAPLAGVIAEIRLPPGALAEVGQIMVVIEPAQSASDSPGRGRQTAPPPSNGQASAPGVKQPGLAGPGQRVLAAPAVRRMALELEVDLSQVTGSGPAGRILPEDVKRFAAQQKVQPEPARPVVPVSEARPAAASPSYQTATPSETGDEVPLQGLRRRIAERMTQAWQIPHVTSLEEVEATHLVALRRQLKPEAERQGARLTYLPFIIKATVQALKDHPYFNASLDMAGQKIRLHHYYHIGVATATPDGLLVPVIRHADRLTLLDLARELSRLAEGAQQRRLAPAELSGSTFTITNVGSFGGSYGTPIINPPEVAILACGRIEEKPVAVQGQVEVRPVLPLALSYDHRLLDGAAAGEFLTRLKRLLADPKLLLLELV